MILFKEFKSQVYDALESSTASNGKISLDEMMLLAIYHLNQDDDGFRHSSDRSISLTEGARILLFSVVRKCLRDASSDAKLVVSCYILNSLAQVVTDCEQSINILKLCYHLISIASASPFQNRLEYSTRGFNVLNVAFTKLHSKQQQQHQRLRTAMNNPVNRRRRRKKFTPVEEYDTTKTDDKENFSCKLETLPLPNRPFSISEAMNFRQLCKLIIGSVLNMSQMFLLSSDHATAFHLLSNYAIPWIRLLSIEKEDQKSTSDVTLYAQSCYRMVWDYAQSNKRTSSDVLRFQAFAIHCLFLKTAKGEEENENQIFYPVLLAEKTLESICHDIYHSLLQNSSKLDPSLCTFHDSVGYLLDQQVSMLPSEKMPMPYVEYCFIRAVQLSQHQQNVTFDHNNPLTIFPFAEKKLDCECLQTTVLAITYLYLSRSQISQNSLKLMLLTHSEKLQSFITRPENDTKMLYKCWKVFHQLNIISTVLEKITSLSEPSSLKPESPEENSLLFEAHVLSKCIAPLSLRLHHAITHQDSSSTIDIPNDTGRLLHATTENEETLLTFVLMMFQTEVQDRPSDHNVSILSTAVDALMKAAIIYEHFMLYHTTDFCFMKAASACCCYHQINLLQIVSKGIATIGRKRLMLLNHNGTALLPMILSCHFFSSQSLVDYDANQDIRKLALRYSSLASSLAFSYPEEATIAYALSIRYFLLSQELTTTHAPDICTDFSVLLYNSYIEENDGAFSTLDKLHRHAFRKKEDKHTKIVAIEHGNVIKKTLDFSKVGILSSENRKLNNNFVSLLLKVITEFDEKTRKTIPPLTILHLLRVTISFLGKEYYRHAKNTSVRGKTYTAESVNISKEFKDAVECSISYVMNSYTHQEQLLANSSIYVFAAKSLFPQGIREDKKTKAESNSTPFNIKELLKEAIRMGKASYELLNQGAWVTTTQNNVTDKEAKMSMVNLTYLIHTSILLIDMSSTINEPLLPEFYSNSIDPDSPIIYILNFCARAVTLVVTRDVGDFATVESLYTSLCQLHTKFIHSGSMVNAARAAYHAGMLDCRSIAVSSTTLALADSDVLLEAELFDSSFKCLMFSDNRSVSKNLLPTSINSLEDCTQLHRAVLMAALEVQCGYHLEESVSILNTILSRTRQYSSNDTKGTTPTQEDTLAFLVNWIRTTCLLFIACADMKKGRLIDALIALKECSVVCKESIKLCRLIVAQETGQANEIFVISRWADRLSSCLMSTSICFSRLGDRRRAEGYSMASLEAIGLHFNDDDRWEVDWLSCRAAGAARECWQISELSLSSKLLNESQKELLFHRLEKRIITDSFYSPISGMHWNVEFIRFLIYRGDKLKRLSTQGVNNGFAECYNTAYKLLTPLLSAEYGPMIDEAIGLTVRQIPGIEKDVLDIDSRFDCRLGSLDSAVKLRLARCIEISGPVDFAKKADALRLYEEVRQSPNSNGIDRARSCYRLGRIFLEKAKRFGCLASLWEGHAEFVDGTEEGEYFSNNISHRATDVSLGGTGFEEYLSRAVSFFREALSCTGRTSEKLTRNILRSLALALGPTKVVSTSLPYGCIPESALLIQFSVGMSSRQLVSRMYADDAQFLREKDKQVKETFEVCSAEVLDSDEKLEKFLHVISKLPNTWIVTAFSLAPSGEMLVSALKSDRDGKVHARAMCIFPPQKGDSNNYFRNTLHEMESILESNRSQLSGMDPATARSFDKDATQKWWENRKSIDLQLKHLIEAFEKRCFSSPRLVDMILCQQLDDQVLLPDDLEAAFDQQCSVTDEEAHGVSLSIEYLHAFKVAELKKKLEVEFRVEKKVVRRLKKADMIDLILSEQQRQRLPTSGAPSAYISSSTVTKNCSMGSRYSESNFSMPKPCTILVLDENLHRFPWENLSPLRGRQVCRVPSLPFVIAPLVDTEQPHVSVDPSRCSYLIDPESNLTSTRHTLEEAINKICTKQIPPWKWNGVVGQIPPISFFTEAMEQPNGLFLYCGHGGGESCFSRARVEDMLYNRQEESTVNHSCRSTIKYRRCKSSIILMGCSSGSLSSGGANRFAEQARPDYCFYEPEGIATWYLMAGAPCVIGNLWDVTDRDIDRYCIELLESFFGNITTSDKDCSSLAECVAKARDACKMRYIVGCAPVCYGVPAFLARRNPLG